MDHCAFEAELDGALELVGRRLGVARRQRGEGGKALRIGGNHGLEPVVDAPRQRDRVGTGKFLRRGRAVREDLHVDAGLVHLLEPQLAEIIEALEHLGIAHAFGTDELRRQLLVPVVFLQRDHRTFRPPQHDAFSFARLDEASSNRGAECHRSVAARRTAEHNRIKRA